jgi:predicted DNA-binding antitoxin AbrB/MazE fold protein
MTTKVNAIYKNGVFLPTLPVAVAEGAMVELTVNSDAGPGSLGPTSLVDDLEEISRLPLQGPNDGFSGADHDKILYGTDGKK